MKYYITIIITILMVKVTFGQETSINNISNCLNNKEFSIDNPNKLDSSNFNNTTNEYAIYKLKDISKDYSVYILFSKEIFSTIKGEMGVTIPTRLVLFSNFDSKGLFLYYSNTSLLTKFNDNFKVKINSSGELINNKMLLLNPNFEIEDLITLSWFSKNKLPKDLNSHSMLKVQKYNEICEQGGVVFNENFKKMELNKLFNKLLTVKFSSKEIGCIPLFEIDNIF